VSVIPLVVEREIKRGDFIVMNLKLPIGVHQDFKNLVKSKNVTMQKLLESFIREFKRHPDSFLVIKKKKRRKEIGVTLSLDQEMMEPSKSSVEDKQKEMINGLADRIGDVAVSPKEYKYLDMRFMKIRYVEGENVIHFGNKTRVPMEKFASIIMKNIDPKVNKVIHIEFDKDYPVCAVINNDLLLEVISDVLQKINSDIGVCVPQTSESRKDG
jgi:hypothetical protein